MHANSQPITPPPTISSLLGRAVQFVRRAHGRRIVRPARNANGYGARCDDHHLGGYRLRRAIAWRHHHAPRCVETATARQVRDVPPLEQAGDAAAKLANGLVLVFGDLLPVETDLAVDGDTPPVGVLYGMEHFRRRQQRLGRNTAVVQTRTAQVVLFDHGRAGAHLCRFQRCDVSARAGTDDEDLEVVVSHWSSITGLLFKSTLHWGFPESPSAARGTSRQAGRRRPDGRR